MNNGNAFRIFIDETVHYLSALKVVVYYADPGQWGHYNCVHDQQ